MRGSRPDHLARIVLPAEAFVELAGREGFLAGGGFDDVDDFFLGAARAEPMPVAAHHHRLPVTQHSGLISTKFFERLIVTDDSQAVGAGQCEHVRVKKVLVPSGEYVRLAADGSN